MAFILAFGLAFPASAHANNNRTQLQTKRIEARQLLMKIKRLFPDSNYRLELERDLDQVLNDIKALREKKTTTPAEAATAPAQTISSTPSVTISQNLSAAQLRAQDRRKRLRLSPVKVKRVVVDAPVVSQNPVYQGKASYYAEFFNGRRTASGTTFSNGDMTAAHRTLSFGSTVKVTSKASGKSIIVTITDRGPYVDGRIIDLTSRGFSELEPLSRGVIDVEIEILHEVK